jgi:hypothetical protein
MNGFIDRIGRFDLANQLQGFQRTDNPQIGAASHKEEQNEQAKQ